MMGFYVVVVLKNWMFYIELSGGCIFVDWFGWWSNGVMWYEYLCSVCICINEWREWMWCMEMVIYVFMWLEFGFGWYSIYVFKVLG